MELVLGLKRGLMRTPHTSTYKGKRVFVILRDGQRFVDKFLDKKAGYIVFAGRGRVPVREIRVFTINKAASGVTPATDASSG